MAVIGLSMPICSDYSFDPESKKVTYSNPVTVGKAVQFSASITNSENQYLYADNGIAETAKGSFQSGELTLGTDRLSQEASQKFLGVRVRKINVPGISEPVTELVSTDGDTPPTLGHGIIEMLQEDDEIKYRAIWLTKVSFNIPEESATTKGETVEFQTPSITGTIMRSDEADENGRHPWKYEATFTKESDALTYLKAHGGSGEITEVDEESLSVKAASSESDNKETA